jgi:hypothetical protein
MACFRESLDIDCPGGQSLSILEYICDRSAQNGMALQNILKEVKYCHMSCIFQCENIVFVCVYIYMYVCVTLGITVYSPLYLMDAAFVHSVAQ